MALDLPEVLALLRAFDEARLSRRQLEGSLADGVMTLPSVPDAPRHPVPEDERALAYRLAEVICGSIGPDEEMSLFVRRVLECLRQVSDPDDVLDLLPLIVHHDEFSILVSKHARGLISAAGIQSVIAKRFAFDDVRTWLERASPERLLEVCERLESNDYRGLQGILVVP